MKTISKIVVLLILIAGTLTSCKEESKNEDQASAVNSDANNPGHPPKHDGDHKGPPHGDHPPRHDGERKGPPGGGDHSPEQTRTLEEIGGYKIGDVATDFKLENVDGKMVSLSDYKDAKGYIVVFTCNGCPFAKMYEDRLIALNNTYASKGYPVIAINPNVSESNSIENLEAMQVRAEDKNFPYPYLADVDHDVFPKYGAVRTPHVFLLDSDRKVQYIGTIDDNAKSASDVKVKYVENAITALESGTLPNPNFTKAIGCPVKAGAL